MTSSVVSEELPPPPVLHNPQIKQDHKGTLNSAQRKCRQDVCVIVVPTGGFYIISAVAVRPGSVS